jgi:putative drug exporter of the RND superfamily
MRHAQNSVYPKTMPNQDLVAPPDTGKRPVVERVAGWSTRHRKTAILGWLLLVFAMIGVGQVLGSKSAIQYDPGQSGQAERALHQLTSNDTTPPTEDVLIQARSESATYATDPAMRAAARQVAAALSALPKAAASIGSLVSKDGHSALVTFTVPGNPNNQTTTVLPAERAVAAVQARYPDLTVAEAGDASISGAVSNSISGDFHQAEETTVPITLILLLVVFGSLIAAGIPLLLAITAVLAAISLLSVVGQWLPIGSTTPEVVAVIGMAVGVDYSLFYLRREREERARGRSHAQALRIAAGTSGKAILISGLTVMISVAGLFLTGLSLFDGMAIGSIAVVGLAVVGSLTVLPALLSWLGPRADKGRIPLLRRRAAARPSRLWGVLIRGVTRHPLVWGGVAVIALLALATPALGMRTGEPAIDAPKDMPAVRTMDRIEQAFPQAPSPAEVVVTGQDLTRPAVSRALAALQGRASGTGPIREPVTVTSLDGGRGLLISVPLAGSGGGTVSGDALLTLRNQVLPSTLGKVSGVSYAVAGDTASSYDFDQQMHDTVPIVIAVVAGFAFVLLALSFGSLVIPVVSIALNLLSVSAAYGLITLIFQDGRLQGPLGYTSFGGIISWEPLFMFVFLFGISMDYHVFLLSRIRELRQGGASTREALVNGISSSAGVITSAAFIMVAVFSIFATMSLIDMKIFGIGMASAVLIDATVVRGILLPAALALLGERAWAAPRWLRRRAVPL